MPRDPLSSTHIMSAPPLPVAPANLQGGLVVLAGHAVGSTFALAQYCILGRGEDADVVLDDDRASRAHALITFRDGGYVIEDRGSTNGTFVNGHPIAVPTALYDGCRLQIGGTLLRFTLQDRAELEASQRIYEASIRDGLTGLYNRRHFDERLTTEFAFAARHKTALAVLLLDLDHFKQINDRYGHPAGDAVLREMGRALRASCRTEDLVARFGGEEFILLVRGIDINGVAVFAERLRSTTERLRVPIDGGVLQVTVSVGAAHNQIGEPLTGPDQLVATADAALYRAKSAGRNRVEGPELPDQHDDEGQRRTSDELHARRGRRAKVRQSTRPTPLRGDVTPSQQRYDHSSKGGSGE